MSYYRLQQMSQRNARNTALDVRQDDPRRRNENLRERLWQARDSVLCGMTCGEHLSRQAVHGGDAEGVGRILEAARLHAVLFYISHMR